jgi:hypothetical protein
MFKILQATRLPLQNESAHLFFGFAQNDDVADQIAQMRFRVRCGEGLAADKYHLDDLLSQMTATFKDGAKTLGSRPFGTTA